MRNSYHRNYGEKKPKIKIVYILIIIILTMIICFAIYMITASDDNDFNINSLFVSSTSTAETALEVNETTASAETTTTVPVETLPVNPVPESETLDSSYFENCAFVGDSITTGLSGYGFITEKNVIASQGMNIDKINTATVTTSLGEITILDALKEFNPQNVYIMLGSNGIAWLSNQKMIEEYSAFVDSVKNELPDVKIYILSIPPVTAEKETAEKGAIQNSVIDSYNSELLNMANEKNLYFVDTNTALKGNDGKFPAESAAKDGMHFQKSTYQTMIDYILKHTVKD